MILNLSEKLTKIENIKHLTQEEKDLLKKILYGEAFNFSNNFFTSEFKDDYKESIFYHDSKSLNQPNFDQKVISILKKLDEKFLDVVIEIPSNISNKEKQIIKDDLEDKYDNIYPIFKINEDIIGGLRIYIDGKLIDQSWEGLVKKIQRSLSSEKISDKSDLKKLIKSISENIKKTEEGLENTENVGIIKSFRDGVILVEGLKDVKMSEIIEIKDTQAQALVMILDGHKTYALVLTTGTNIKEGMYASSTGKLLQMPVGNNFLGRVVDSFGREIDGLGEIKEDKFYPHEKIAPGVMNRKSVSTPLQTGIISIDALIPIGRGQRELIIGDRQTGKSTIAIDTILNQKGKDVICIYVCIGQRESFVSSLYEKLKWNGAMDYSIIVNSPASDTAMSQFLAPYAGIALAEYFLDQGKEVLIVYDDLSKHAVAYREVSLLLRRPPGREAYPGDVFYIHSRLLERAVRLNEENGGGSITALPIIETQAGDVSAFIPTNVISITDGQIFLETDLFNKGVIPAVNVGISVSRVGGSAQTKIMKKISGTLKLDLATYYELEAFSQFSSDLDENTKKSLNRGKKVVGSLIQDQNAPYQLFEEVLIIYAVTNGYFDLVLDSELKLKINEFLIFIKNNNQDLISEIENKKELDDSIKDKLKIACNKFFK